ncbi:MAG TPA: hypothetical protein ENN08_00210 [Bacteroidales bacterium]|nr:hypothetical protein [Bacteroidales bacterium]
MIALKKIVDTVTDMPLYSKFFVFMLSVFAPIRVVIYVVVFLVFVDMITSIYYQMQCQKKTRSFLGHLIDCLKVVESHKLRRTVSKLFFYVLALMSFYVFDAYVLKIHPLGEDVLVSFSLTNLAAILICITELTSISSNISKITANPIFKTIMMIFGRRIKDKLRIKDEADETIE